ncbi:hypothetical protein [Leptobacterium sp. I13]|uniref:hypothetical protein n=1 Tax=Leptobacterium meishanense TaxID=3128904 RepID=UPI0030EE2B6D
MEDNLGENTAPHQSTPTDSNKAAIDSPPSVSPGSYDDERVIDKAKTPEEIGEAFVEESLKTGAKKVVDEIPQFLNMVINSVKEWLGPRIIYHSTDSIRLGAGGRLFITLYEVDDEAEVFINGNRIGGKTLNTNQSHKEVTIGTPILNLGDHLLNIVINNTGRNIWQVRFLISDEIGNGLGPYHFKGRELNTNTHIIMTSIFVS